MTYFLFLNDLYSNSMRTVLPGKPQARLQAICTAQWEKERLVVKR